MNKPVRYRDGFNNQGGVDARYLARNELVPYLKKRRADGQGGTVIAHKKGEFLEVTRENVLTDGFYSLGRVDGVRRIVGSATARGRFRDRGPALAGDGGTELDQLYFYGRGLGLDFTITPLGSFADFDGAPIPGYQIDVYRTRNGRAHTLHYSFEATAPFGYGTLITPVRGAVYGGAGARAFQAGFGYQTLLPGGQHAHIFLRDSGDAQTLGATPYLPNQLAGYFLPLRLGPAAFVSMGAYLRPTYSGSTVDVAACPGLVFSFSSDAGATWSTASSTELFSEFFATVQTLATGLGNAPVFNEAVNVAGLAVAPLGANIALAYAVVPYMDGSTLKAKVKLGVINLASRTLIATLTLLDGTPDEAVGFWSGGCFAVEGGAIVMTRPLGTGGYATLHNEKPRMLFTPDGVGVLTQPPMPQENYRTGAPSAIGPNTIAAPMFDGVHALYESRDRGATWSRRAIFTEEGPAPAPAVGRLALQDFSVLTFLRRENQPANGTPGAPWASDSRIEAPIL